VQNSGNITGHQDRDYEQSSLWIEFVFPKIPKTQIKLLVLELVFG